MMARTIAPVEMLWLSGKFEIGSNAFCVSCLLNFIGVQLPLSGLSPCSFADDYFSVNFVPGANPCFGFQKKTFLCKKNLCTEGVTGNFLSPRASPHDGVTLP